MLISSLSLFYESKWVLDWFIGTNLFQDSSWRRAAIMVPDVKVKTPQKEAGIPADADLLKGCWPGDEQSWEMLIRRYLNLIYSVPIGYRFSLEDAAEMMTTTMMTMAKR
jgi:hypothetical protein